MPSDTRVLIDSVVTRDDARGRRVIIQGTVVPTGQRVPLPGEAIRMQIEDLPFMARIPLAMQAAGQEDIRRLLWHALREVLGQGTITNEEMRTLSRRIAVIAGQLMTMERPDARPPMVEGPTAAAAERERVRGIINAARIAEEGMAPAALMQRIRENAAAGRWPNNGFTEPSPTTNVEQELHDAMTRMGFDIEAEATTRSAATREAINAARIAEEGMASASWPTLQRVLGRSEHPANPDRADGRELRNIKIRDRDQS